MLIQVRPIFASLVLMSVVAIHVVAFAWLPQVTSLPAPTANLTGRWRVKFALMGGVEKNLVFDSEAKGAGSLLLLDTGPGDQPVPAPLPATWSQLTNGRVSFSGEVELPLGSCCREIGTLVFKGKFTSSNSISGRLIFVTSVDEEESPYKFHSRVGNFTATRAP